MYWLRYNIWNVKIRLFSNSGDVRGIFVNVKKNIAIAFPTYRKTLHSRASLVLKCHFRTHFRNVVSSLFPLDPQWNHHRWHIYQLRAREWIGLNQPLTIQDDNIRNWRQIQTIQFPKKPLKKIPRNVYIPITNLLPLICLRDSLWYLCFLFDSASSGKRVNFFNCHFVCMSNCLLNNLVNVKRIMLVQIFRKTALHKDIIFFVSLQNFRHLLGIPGKD